MSRSGLRWSDFWSFLFEPHGVRAELVEAVKEYALNFDWAWLVDSLEDKSPEWISAVAAVTSVCGLFLVWRQLRLSKKIAQPTFEDTLGKEYRDLLIWPDEVFIPVRAELVEAGAALRQAQGERFIFQRAGSIVKKIPKTVLLDSDLNDFEYKETLDEFFRYFDLSSTRIMLKRQKRIGNTTLKKLVLWHEI